MTAEHPLELIRLRAVRYAERRGLSCAQDFGSYCAEHAIKGRKAPLRFLLVDYQRGNYGGLRSESERLRFSESTGWSEIVETPTVKRPGHPAAAQTPGPCEMRAMIDGSGLSQMERACLILEHVWGFTRVEAADLFGVDPSRISQIVGKAVRRARKRLKRGDWG